MKNRNGRMEIGLRKGVRAFFDVDDITIAYWASAWTGREIVTIDDRVVSRHWNFRFVSEHPFEHAGVQYKIVFTLLSMLRGEIRVELYRNGLLIDSDQFRQSDFGIDPKTGKFSAWRLMRKLAPYFVLGMIAGASAALLVDYLTGG